MYNVSLKQFDGPLDLLLTLINRASIAIEDIFVSEITEQYLGYMSGVGELDMDQASEFLQMAATLLEIKSKSLLPVETFDEDYYEESLEETLVRQLTEYKRFKELSGVMREMEQHASALKTKLPEEYPLPPKTYELTGLTLEGLTAAFARVLGRLRDRELLDEIRSNEIKREKFTVHECMTRIQSRIKVGEVRFDELFEDAPSRDEVITVFLALLELLRVGKAMALQLNPYDDIVIKRAA
ncbi:MAG: segregation/condensation protein A [Clostridia bacterium]|nr:segregation/condensation protein A [Clostridia bacterium]